MITTERLLLRPLTIGDLDAFHRIWGDPDVITWGPKQSKEETRAFLADVIARTAASDVFAWFALVRRDDRRLVGDIVLRPAAWNPADVEIGWHVAKDAQGRGFATEGARAILAHAVRHGIDHVEAVILPHNRASQRVAEKIGMTRRGRIVHADLEHDLWSVEL